MGSKDQKREEIIKAAIKVFIEKGIDNTSMEDLAKALGKTKSYFYFYFRSKEDLILSIFEYIKEKALMELKGSLRGVDDPAKKLEMWIREHFRQVRENPEFLRFIYSFIFSSTMRRIDLKLRFRENDRYFALINEIIKEGQKEGRIIEGDVNVLSNLIRGAIYGVVRYLFETGKGVEDLKNAEEIVTSALLNGILYQNPR